MYPINKSNGFIEKWGFTPPLFNKIHNNQVVFITIKRKYDDFTKNPKYNPINKKVIIY